MAGLNVDRQVLDNKMGNTATRLRDAFADAQKVHNWLSATDDTELLAFGYSADDIAAFRAVFGRLDALAKVGRGEQAGVNGAYAYTLGMGDLTGLS